MKMRRPLLLCFAGIFMSQPAVSEHAQPHPVWMEVRQEDRQVIIAVLAASNKAARVSVELDVQGGSKLHTITRATLNPGQAPVVLSRAAIDAHHPWKARLTITPEDSERYVVERSDHD